jgi:hypothetical protein
MATYESVKYSFVGNAITALQSPNIADGSVTNTEFQHLDGTTSDIQTQLNAKFGSAGGTFTGNVQLNDNVHLYVGSGGATDLDIYHDSSNSYIKNSTGNLNVNADSILFRDDGNTRNMFNAVSTGAFNAYHNNTLRFSTTSAGAQVTGELVVTGNMTSQANVNGNGQNLTNLNASNASSGTLPMARLSGTLPALNGSALTNLNGSNISSGTLPMARLSGTLPALNGSALTNLNASNLASGTVPEARLPAAALGGGLSGGEFFTANGTWTCPAGVTTIFAIITGGGGGAGGQGTRYQTYNYNTRSGRGGNGGHFEGLIAVTPGTTYNIVIGTGGNCGDNYAFTFSPIRSGFAGTNTTAFGITATGGGGGSGSFTGQTGGNPNPSGVTGTPGTASGTAIITFRNLSAFQGAFAMKGLNQPQSATQSYTIAGISPHVITGPSDIYAAGYGGEEGSNVNIAANDIKSGTGGNGGMVQIFF